MIPDLILRTARRKVFELEMLPEVLATLRADGKKIVHCHGVFDLIHIGHIRHFEQAKQLGHVLVVTVTPDRFVNKGPHRPVFTEALRAEAVAALDCVDYVAINQWPMAVETIRIIRPDFYVKGMDYRDASSDRTGGIALEEVAVEAAGGRLAFTDDITFSSTTLINRHVSPFSPEVNDYLADFRTRYTAADVIGFIERVQTLKVLVVGEAIIDEYQYCEAIGKSSKEPMLAVKRLSTETFAGGVLAVGNNVASFADHVGVLTCIGGDRAYAEFIQEKLDPRIRSTLLAREGSPTIVKRRFVENYFFTKLLEVYELNDGAPGASDNAQLCRALEEQLPLYDVVIVVDFGHGMITDDAVDQLCRHSRFLAVNAQSNAGNTGYHTISRYPRADFVCLAEPEIRLEARDRRGELRPMVSELATRMNVKRLVVTRGKFGCICYSNGVGFTEPPAVAGRVVDRMGAGDAFLSVAALCAAQDTPMEIVGFIGNAVGAQAVATVGHRNSIDRISLFRHIESLLK